MINNLVLRRLRYALNLREESMVDIFALSEHKITKFSISCLLKKDEEEAFVECTDVVLEKFLDGLIIKNRGVRENSTEQPAKNTAEVVRLNNNIIMKKLRIALEFKDDDMLDVMKKAGFRFSKTELTALFRKRGTRNFKACGDQLLRNFLIGLCEKFRPSEKKTVPALDEDSPWNKTKK